MSAVREPEHNGYGVLNLPDTILNERCAFKLVAACEVKRTHGVSLSLPANGDAFVQFKNGARTKLLGDRVLLPTPLCVSTLALSLAAMTCGLARGNTDHLSRTAPR